MFVKIKIFKEDWEVLAQPTLGHILLRRRLDLRQHGNHKGGCLIRAAVTLQPVLSTTLMLT